MKYNPSKVSPTDLLEIFFKMHDPTTKNRQGADVGTQYRRVGGGGYSSCTIEKNICAGLYIRVSFTRDNPVGAYTF